MKTIDLTRAQGQLAQSGRVMNLFHEVVRRNGQLKLQPKRVVSLAKKLIHFYRES